MRQLDYYTYQKSIQRLGLGLAFFGLAGLLAQSAEQSRILSEQIYWPVSVFIQKFISSITGFLPFSLAEFSLYAFILFIPAVIVWFILRSRKNGGWLKRGIALLTAGSLIAGTLSFSFQLFWGLTYYRFSIQDRMGLVVQFRPTYELDYAASALIKDLNDTAAAVERNADGSMKEISFSDLAERTRAAFNDYTQSEWASVKKVAGSSLMSYTNITGIFTAFTGESNVNYNNTTPSLPFVMAHEMSHRYGVSPEDEANFFAFLVCKESSDPVLRYSAYFTALQYVMSELHGADSDAFQAQWKKINPDVIADMKEYNEHWSRYSGGISELAEEVNSTYLKVQGQADGVKSYGRVTDLLIAYYINDEN